MILKLWIMVLFVNLELFVMGGIIVDDCEFGLLFFVFSNFGVCKRGIIGWGLFVWVFLLLFLFSCGCCCCLFDLLILLLENMFFCGFYICCDNRVLFNFLGFINIGLKMVFFLWDVFFEIDLFWILVRKNFDKLIWWGWGFYIFFIDLLSCDFVFIWSFWWEFVLCDVCFKWGVVCFKERFWVGIDVIFFIISVFVLVLNFFVGVIYIMLILLVCDKGLCWGWGLKFFFLII